MLIVVIAIVTFLNARYANDVQKKKNSSLTAIGHFNACVNWTYVCLRTHGSTPVTNIKQPDRLTWHR